MKNENTMPSLRWGGYAAIGLTLIYIVGIVMQATLLHMPESATPSESIAFIADNQLLVFGWITLLYIVFGAVLMALTTALMLKFIDDSRMAIFIGGAGIIWSTLVIASGMIYQSGMQMAIQMYAGKALNAETIYQITQMLHGAIGGNNEIVGGIWTLLISIASLKRHMFKPWMNVLGIIAGIAGCLTMLPIFSEPATMVFAFGQMIWWVGIGVKMLKW